MYVIRPAHSWWNNQNWHDARALPEGFRYASDSNPHWLSPEELRELVDAGAPAEKTPRIWNRNACPREEFMAVTSLSRDVLAIEGGSPVRGTLLPYGHQSIDERDIEAVVETLRSDWLTTGPKVGEFEERFAACVGATHAVSFSSGTAALHGAAFAAGLKAGDEAITSPLTFVATANCVLYQGATPVFADVSRDTLNLDPERVAACITPRTRVILPVDYAGHPADLPSILELTEKHGLTVIEDACHALGAEQGGRKIGSRGHMTVFSFHPVKHLTTGEGGMVTTNDSRIAETLRRFRNHGISSEARQRQAASQWHYEMTLLGFNPRLTDVACALGLAQLERLDANLARRRQIAARYTTAFREIEGVIPPVVRSGVDPAWHLYPIASISRDCRLTDSKYFTLCVRRISA